MENLSHMLPNETALTAGESMSAGNTTTKPGVAMGAPGSKPVNPLPLDAEVDTPELDIPATKGPTILLGTHGRKRG